jgi:hypothetical protein
MTWPDLCCLFDSSDTLKHFPISAIEMAAFESLPIWRFYVAAQLLVC